MHLRSDPKTDSSPSRKDEYQSYQNTKPTSSATAGHELFPLMPHDYRWDNILAELGLETWSSEASELVENVYPCSPMQESIYVARETGVKQLDRIATLFEVDPSITFDQLENAWKLVVARHETLRTIYVPSSESGSSRLLDAVVLKTIGSNMERVESKDEAAVSALYQESCTNSQDFPKGRPLHRLTAYHTGDNRQFCVFEQSELITDGLSMVNAVAEMCAILSGLPVEDAPGYSKYIEYLQRGVDADQSLDYWVSYLDGAEPCNFPSLRGRMQAEDLEPSRQSQLAEFPLLRSQELINLCTKLDITVSIALQVAWALLLRSYTGSDEVCFGYLSSGRNLPLDGIERIYGPLVNLVACRVRPGGNSLRNVIETVRDDLANSLPFHSTPLRRIQQVLGSAENKLFNTILNTQYAPMFTDERDDAKLKFLASYDASDFGVAIKAIYSDTTIKMQLAYSTGLISSTMAERVAQTLVSIIDNLLNSKNLDCHAEELAAISSHDLQQAIRWNQETLTMTPELPTVTVHGLIEETARHRPTAPAVLFSEKILTYRDLNLLATTLACRMLESLSDTQRLIPLYFEKSAAYSVAILATLKCGRGFVPVDISNPSNRVQLILEQLGISPSAGLVVCSRGRGEQISPLSRHTIELGSSDMVAGSTLEMPQGPSMGFPEVQQTDPAYVIFTSGSTGTPKGVLVSHGAYAHASRSHPTGIRIGPQSRVLQFASYGFDTSMEDHLTTFVVGACLCVPTEAERQENLVDFINRTGANWLHITPSMTDAFPPDSVPSLETIVLGGEPMTNRNVTQWAIPGRHLVQSYGPSECSVTSTINSDISVDRDPTNIGRAFGGCATWITDSNNPNILCPIGAIGELLMEGPILAQGYLGQASTTASVFISGVTWAPEKRLYRTGDLVRYGEDGMLRFVGRTDSRVKIHGQRMECGEVESQLVMQSSVQHAIVLVPKSGPGASQLIAVVELKSDTARSQCEEVGHLQDEVQLAKLDIAETTNMLRNWLSDQLPAWMIPGLFIFVCHIPRNASRKLHRKQMMQYVENMSPESYQQLVSQMDGPGQNREGTEMECLLRRVWCQVLNVPEDAINWNTSWFSLGGDSISAMMLSSQLRKERINIRAAEILRLRNIQRIADHIRDTTSANKPAKAQNFNTGRTTIDIPWELSPIQQMSFQFFPDGDRLDQQAMVVHMTLYLDDDMIFAAFAALVAAHPMLSTKFEQHSSPDGGRVWMQRMMAAPSLESACSIRFHQDGDTAFRLERISETRMAIDIVQGPIMGVDVFRTNALTTISICIHHLSVDAVSWRIMFHELENFILKKESIQPELLSFQSWCQAQHKYAESLRPSLVLPDNKINVDMGYWSMEGTPNVFGDSVSSSLRVGSAEMATLMDACDQLDYDYVDVFCTAIATSFSEIFKARSPPTVFIEGHGRESFASGLDPSRTVGWFTTVSPLVIKASDVNDPDPMTTLEQIRRFRDGTPMKGFDYFTSRFLNRDGIKTFGQSHTHAEIILNFLGAYQQFERRNSVFRRCDDPDLLSGLSAMRQEQRKASARYSLISIVAFVENGSLSVKVEWNKKMAFQNELALWPQRIREHLLLLIESLSRLGTAMPHEEVSAPALRFTRFGVDEETALAATKSLGLRPDQVESIYPCSPIQEGLMASQLRDSDTSSVYDQTFLMKITSAEGKLVGSEQLVGAWLRMIQKHAVLRTVFVESDTGEFIQVVLNQIDPVVQVKRNIGEDELKSSLFEVQRESLRRPLDGSPLHRFTVCETTDGSMYILLAKNHLLTDGISTRILMQDFAILCGDPSGAAQWDPQYCYLDYIRYVYSQDLGRARQYWSVYLRGIASCNFPVLRDTKTPGEIVSHASVSLQIDAHEVDVRRLCRSHDLTVSNIFQMAWGLVLSVYLNSNTTLFGFLVSGRDLPVDGIHQIVGPVVNMIPLKCDIQQGMTAIELVKALQYDYIKHLSWQTISLAQMQHAARTNHESANFNTILNIQKPATTSSKSGPNRASVEMVKSRDITEYGLALTVTDKDGDYGLSLEYSTSLVTKKQAARVLSAFAAAVKSVVANPEGLVRDLDLVCDEDRKQIQDWDLEVPQMKVECVHELIETTALSIPEKQAIYGWDGQLTYGELMNLADRLSQKLISLGIQPEEIVPLCFEKSIWGIVAMVGVAKAGAAFAHLDPSSPVSRKKQIISQTRSRVALASVQHQGIIKSLVSEAFPVSHETLLALPAGREPLDVYQSDLRVQPSNALYVVFTSGSTGEPKGVVIEHQNFCSALAANTTRLQIRPSSRILQFSSFVFDASLEETLTALVAGACICVPSDDDRMNPESLTEFIHKARVNWAALTPSFLQNLNPSALVPPLEFITVHAEPVSASLVRQWAPLVHTRPSYGPTECSVTSTIGMPFTEFSDASNIGWPVGCRGRVVDPHDPQRLLPIGAVGELVLEGPILGRGYLNQPAETAAAFPHVVGWFDGVSTRVYRTGDLVHYAEDGSLRIHGRRDMQVKIRGQRVELGEIQGQLDASPDVHHALVLKPRSGLLQERLVSVLSIRSSSQTLFSASANTGGLHLLQNSPTWDQAQHATLSEALSRIRTCVSARLPLYMVPDTWLVVEDLPTLPSHKLDRKKVELWLETINKATLLLARQIMGSARNIVGAETKTEELIRATFSQILDVPIELVSVTDHFIALGGDSISAMLVSRALKKAGVPVTTQDVLISNNIRDLASRTQPLERKALASIEEQSSIEKWAPGRLPSASDIAKECGLALKSGPKILSVLHATPFQHRTTYALLNSPRQPYLYNTFRQIERTGTAEQAVDPTRLLNAWRATVERHSILRTAVFLTEDTDDAYQVVLDESAMACEAIEVDSENDAFDASVAKTKQVRASFSRTSLAPPLWFTLFITRDKQLYVHFLIGHMLIDHVAFAHVLSDWDALYRGLSLSKEPEFANYVDDLLDRDVQASTDFWVRRLRGVEPTFLSTTLAPPEAGRTPAEGSATIHSFRVDIDDDIHDYCRSTCVTLSTLLQFAWAMLLGAYTKQEAVCFGHLVSDRDVGIDGADEMVGPMLSIMVAHVVLDHRDNASAPLLPREAIQKLQRDNTTGMAHKVFDLTAVERQLGLQPPTSVLFNTLVNYRKVSYSGPSPAMKLRAILKEDPHEQHMILSFNEAADASHLDAALTYDSATYSPQNVDKMVNAYLEIIALLIAGRYQTVPEILGCVVQDFDLYLPN